MRENIFEHLMMEHDEMREMMKTLVEQYERRTFEEFGKELEQHQEAEEEVVYKRFKNEQDLHDIVLEGLEEHRVGHDLLRKLQSQKPGTDVWMARMKVLSESVEHHLEEEEAEFFTKAQHMVSEEEAMKMNEEFHKAKKKVPIHA